MHPTNKEAQPQAQTQTELETATASPDTPMITPLCNVLPKALPKTLVRVYLIRHGQTNWNLSGRIQGGGYNVPLNAMGREQAKRAALVLEGIPLDAVASSSLSRAEETANFVMEHYNRTTAKSKSNTEANTKQPLRIVDSGFNEMRFGTFEGIKFKRRTGGKDDGWAQESNEILRAKQERLLVEKAKVYAEPEYCFPSRDSSGDDPCEDDEDKVHRVDSDFGSGESTRLVEARAIKALSETLARVLEQQDGLSDGDTDKNEAKTMHVAIVSHGRTNKVLLTSMLTGDAGIILEKVGQDNAGVSVFDHNGFGDVGEKSWKGGWTTTILNYSEHTRGL